MKIECNQECGAIPWCCFKTCSMLPMRMGQDIINDMALLFIWRGKRIFESNQPELPGYLVLSDEKCEHASEDGCAIHENKPGFCREFPLEDGFTVLTEKCPFSKRDGVFVIENLKELKEEDFLCG